MKKYKLGGYTFIIDLRFARFEHLMKKFSEFGINTDIFKNILMGRAVSIPEILEAGATAGVQLFDTANLRVILAIILVKWSWPFRIPLLGMFLFKHYYKFDESEIEINKKLLLNATHKEADEVMTDFFAGMIASNLTPSASSNDSPAGN